MKESVKKSGKLIIAFLLILQVVSQGFYFLSPASSVSAEELPAKDHLLEVPQGYIGIYTADDLNKVRDNLSGKYILMGDIDLSNATGEGGEFYNNGAGWNPIGIDTAPFKGILDGNGYEISGLKINILSDKKIYAGLVGYANSAEIKNLKISQSDIKAENNSYDSASADVYASALVGYGNNIKMSNVYNTGSVEAVSLFSSYAGGVAGLVTAGYSTSSTITDSTNSGSIIASTAGGIAGSITRTNIIQTSNEGDINSSGTNKYSGGIAGYVYSNSSISKSNNSGSITYSVQGGGIAGYIMSSGIQDSYNNGNLSGKSSGSKGGGIAGSVYSTNITSSYNTGTVTAPADYSYGGGIAGYVTGTSSILKTYNLGEVNVDSAAGGVAGEVYGSIIAQSYNGATINGSYSGGISGWISGANIVDSYNIGLINAKYDAGGITGYGRTATIKNTYNVGSVNTGSYYSSSKGGIAGDYEGTITNSYYLDTISRSGAQSDTDSAFKKTFDEMLTSATFNGFDFNNIWSVDGNAQYKFPQLVGLPSLGDDKAVSISLKSQPDKLTYIQGEDIDVTGGVLTVKSNMGNTFEESLKPEMINSYYKNQIGDQWIVIKKDGAITSLKITVIAKDSTPPKQPVVNDVTDQSVSVSGTAEAGSKVEVKESGNILGTVQAGNDGAFQITVPLKKAGTELTVTATDAQGNVSPETIVVVKDVTAPSKPTVNEVTDKDTSITGEAEPGSTIRVYLYNNVIATAVTGEDGKFVVNIPLQKAGDELYITAFDKAENPSEPFKVIVKDVTAPEKPIVTDKVTDQIDSISGTAEGLSTVEVYAGDLKLGSTTANNNGYFSVTIQKQKAGTELTLVSKDNAHNVSEAVKLTVLDGLAPETPTVNALNDQSTLVTGKAEPGSLVQIKVNGTVIAKDNAKPDGTYSIKIPLQKAQTEVVVTATDVAGNESNGAYMAVEDVTPPVKPIVQDVFDQDPFVKGEAEPGTIIEVITTDTWIIGNGKVGSDGRFKINIPVQKAGTQLDIVSWDAYGHSSPKASIFVKKGAFKGWAKRDGEWYYYDPTTGKMTTGWLLTGGKWYFLDSSGIMQTGWEKVSGKWYYFDGGGVMKIGWLKLSNTWYYFDGSGAMKTNWLKVGSTWYYFDGSGAMKTGWLKLGNYWYYMDASGAMKTGKVNISGKWYAFNSSGVWIA